MLRVNILLKYASANDANVFDYIDVHTPSTKFTMNPESDYKTLSEGERLHRKLHMSNWLEMHSFHCNNEFRTWCSILIL